MPYMWSNKETPMKNFAYKLLQSFSRLKNNARLAPDKTPTHSPFITINSLFKALYVIHLLEVLMDVRGTN